MADLLIQSEFDAAWQAAAYFAENAKNQSDLINEADPTGETYSALVFAYVYFNRALFDGVLPPVLFTLRSHRGAYGYFSPDRFQNQDGVRTHEVAMNPMWIAQRTMRSTAATLAHEMAHVRREQIFRERKPEGKKRYGYHCKQWAQIMLDIGLRPTDDGTDEGSMTGWRVSHLIVQNGFFDQATRILEERGFFFPWAERVQRKAATGGETGTCGTSAGASVKTAKSRNKSNTRFVCRNCGQVARANHTANLLCGIPTCNQTELEADF